MIVSCKNCEWYFEGNEQFPIHCQLNPPNTILIPVKNRITDKEMVSMQPLFGSVYPEGLGVCSHFEKKAASYKTPEIHNFNKNG